MVVLLPTNLVSFRSKYEIVRLCTWPPTHWNNCLRATGHVPTGSVTPLIMNSMSGVSGWNMKNGLSTSTVGPSLRCGSPQQAQPARWQRGFCNAWRENWRRRSIASTQLQLRGVVIGFRLLCCVVQSFAFAEVDPTASIPSTQNESWPLWRAEWRFTNLLHAACRTFFSWFPFPSFLFPHADLYLHVLLDSNIGVIFSTYRYALTSGFYPSHFWASARTRTPAHVYPAHNAPTHIPTPRRFLSKPSAAFYI